jgi:hypothetical protein
MRLLPVKKILKYFSYALITVFICNIIFVALYSFSALIPKNSLIESLQKSQNSGVLKTPLNSIQRSSTGLGIDYGTECVAIAIGLKSLPVVNEKNRFIEPFYDGYLVSGANIGVFDPCSGLVEILNANNSGSEISQLNSYARNWWGMSILVHIGILFFGLATFKTYLYISTIILLGIFYYSFSNYFRDWKIGLYLLFPIILFGDFQELHNSFPYSLFTIQLFLFAWIALKLVVSKKYTTINFFVVSIILGSIYNFIFWYNFHLILTLIPVVIYLLKFRVESIGEICKKIFIFLSGFSFGFIVSTLFKWFIGIVLFGNEIWITIKNALGLRLSSGTSGLNQPLSDYSSAFSDWPLSIRAIVLNCMVFASKFIDPRNSNYYGLILVMTMIIFSIFRFLKPFGSYIKISRLEVFAFLLILSIPLFYYALTPNHSFNHAALSYRALPISLGFILSFMYLRIIRNDSPK